MSNTSKHIEEIIAKHNRTANLQVVFVDVEKYSKRRTLNQIAVIDGFTESLKKTLTDVSKQYTEYAQANNVNFQTDIIFLPTGDGAAVIFSFDGLHDIHLSFAKTLLKNVSNFNNKTQCDKFVEQGWCNCHPNFQVRIGISEGKGILYSDVNSQYNVAGNVINIASRVMGFANANQIIFSDEAHRQIVDMVDDPNLVDCFREFPNIRVKHGLRLNLFQYLGSGEDYVNIGSPSSISLMKKFEEFSKIVPGIPNLDALDQSPGEMGSFIDRYTDAMKIMTGLMPGPTHSIKSVEKASLDVSAPSDNP